MEQVRCTNCGSTAVIPEESGGFCKCFSCGSMFSVSRGEAFSKVQLDHTKDLRAWREYLAKQLKLQQDSVKARDYSGVKLFAQKILSVLPDDFCAQYYNALADRYDDNDTAFVAFLSGADLTEVTPDEIKEVVNSLIATVEPKYVDGVKAFIATVYPDTAKNYDALIERNIRQYIQRLRDAKATERDVFICHRTAAPDQDIADAICTRLEERGLRCWIAPRNILAGSQNYDRDILKGVENCRLFLLVSSFKSIYSEDCEMELKAAVLADKVLYSYRIDDTPYDGVFDKALAKVQWLDASDDPYAHLEQMVVDIKGILANDERVKQELEEKRLQAREKERRLAEERRAQEEERISRLEKIVSGGVAAVAAPARIDVRSKLKRAEIEVQSRHFDRAEQIIDGVLDDDPENSLAWWLMLLCDYRITTDDALLEVNDDFTANCYYKNALRFATPAFAERIEAVNVQFQNSVIKNVHNNLERAQLYYDSENYAELRAQLSKIQNVFGNENSLVYSKFPDVASRYYWFKLWAKYEQNPLVCVEDITRETEYKKAMKYASPAQAHEYEKARETVSRNAQMFLRERSKSRVNDSKLTDYLVDNKNILPIDTYNYYSSLMYYRRMLKSLGVTEDQLRKSTMDISTNEYFMLAQSMATDAQKLEYKNLEQTIENNRVQKTTREQEAINKQKAEAERKLKHKKNNTVTVWTIIVATTVASIVLTVIAGALYQNISMDVIYDFDFLDEDYFLSFAGVMTAASIVRIISSAFCISTQNRCSIFINTVNIALSIVCSTMSVQLLNMVTHSGMIGDIMDLDLSFVWVELVITVILSIINIAKQVQWKNDAKVKKEKN